MIKKIGVLTGGGDCPGLNAVLRAVVKTAMVKYHWKVVGFRDGYRGLVLDDCFEFKPGSVSGILDKGGTILGTSNRDNPFKFKVEKDGQTEYIDMSDKAVENIKAHEIDCMILIGGDGTLTSARDFSRKGVKIIGVPKTIDNDLSATDTTFGFMTAVDTATEAIDKLHSTAESHHRVMILEVMGRYAGWIALASGIAGGAETIIVPENPFDIDKICKQLEENTKSGKTSNIIVIAEGVMSADKLMNLIKEKVDISIRTTVLGHIQRGGSPTVRDRVMASMMGAKATELLKDGIYNQIIAFRDNQVVGIEINEALDMTKTIDEDMIELSRVLSL
jgi:6-phosphofructokinase 1